MKADENPSLGSVEEIILAEHRRIRTIAKQIQDTGHLVDLTQRLHELHGVLEMHFMSEETTDGFFDFIRSMAPAQYAAVDRLQKEHRALLAEIDHVMAQARACLAGPVADVLKAARDLTHRLAKHEAAEDRLLGDSMYNDVGQGDS